MVYNFKNGCNRGESRDITGLFAREDIIERRISSITFFFLSSIAYKSLKYYSHFYISQEL
jgi:hypothetical protein